MRLTVTALAPCLAAACSFDAYDIRLAARDATVSDAPDASDALVIDAVTGPVASSASCTPTAAPGCGRARITGGTFVLGSTEAWDSDAPPPGRATPLQRNITVSTFVLDRYEVTVGRFRRFVEDTAAPRGLWTRTADDLRADCNWTPTAGDREAHPINCVDWDAAQAFCAWDVPGGSLPTEAQLELAARGTTARRWPWATAERLVPAWVCWDRMVPMRLGTCVVDDPDYARGQSPEGVWHLVGNVSEWTADLYAGYGNDLCWGDRPRVDPRCVSGTEDFPTVRKGAWTDGDVTSLLPGARWKQSRLYRHAAVGFRCAAPR